MKQIFAILLACATSLAASGAPVAARNGAAPWTWTTEERLSARFNTTAILERTAQYEHRLTPAQREATVSTEPVDPRVTRIVIEGRQNPELFLPTELMRGLLHGCLHADPAVRTKNRPLYSGGTAALGVTPDEFWSILSDARIEAQRKGLSNDSDIADCQINKYVLDAMRSRFGRENFDKFLYVTVAPYAMSWSGVTNIKLEMDDLRQKELGCRD